MVPPAVPRAATPSLIAESSDPATNTLGNVAVTVDKGVESVTPRPASTDPSVNPLISWDVAVVRLAAVEAAAASSDVVFDAFTIEGATGVRATAGAPTNVPGAQDDPIGGQPLDSMPS